MLEYPNLALVDLLWLIFCRSKESYTHKGWKRYFIFHCATSMTQFAQSHSNCVLVECQPYGKLRNCMVQHMSQLSNLIAHCQGYIPTLSAPILLDISSSEDIQPLLKTRFPLLSLKFDDKLYDDYCARIKELLAFSVFLEVLPGLQNNFHLGFGIHSDTPAEGAVNRILQGLCSLRNDVLELKHLTQSNWYDVLDNNPRRTKAQLDMMMSEVRPLLARMSRLLILHRQVVIDRCWTERFLTYLSPTSKLLVLVNGLMTRLSTTLCINGVLGHPRWGLARSSPVKSSSRITIIHVFMQSLEF